MNVLAQYPTPESATQRIVAGLSTINPSNLLELGVGQGDLLTAANNRWPQAQLYAADIDIQSLQSARTRLPHAAYKQVDALTHDLPDHLGLELGSIDLALGNPPYGRIDTQDEHLAILNEANLADVIPRGLLTREIVFLAQNLRFLRNGGELAVILPNGVGTSHPYKKLRGALMQRHGLWRVLELPPRLFKHTEAKTLVFFLRKGTSSTHVSLGNYDGSDLQIGYQDALGRVDASFYSSDKIKTSIRTLADLNPEILRGAITKLEAKQLKVATFHTTDFKHCISNSVNFSGKIELPERNLVQAGDILLPRVGSRCLHYAAIVESGQAVFTDCIYRLRVEKPWRRMLLDYLASKTGIELRKTFAHGVCANSLSKSDLLNLPIPNNSFIKQDMK